MLPTNPKISPRDLTDEEFAQLDDLLLETPEPLQPLDAVMLDGYLCGVLVQPVPFTPEQWLPHVFDFDAKPLPEKTDPHWLERTQALILRRYNALNHAILEDGWFNPLILEFDEDEAPAPLQEGEVDPLADLSPTSQPIMPWVAGFQHATLCFPQLAEMPDDAVVLAMARLFRHLPCETPEEKEILVTLDQEHPLANLDEAIEELVVTVADLCDLTRDQRYKVEPVRRVDPKLGRNDPCHCGSGKKFKQCHGQ
jgi:uncharacterized protein